MIFGKLSQAKNKVFYNTKGPAYFSSSLTYNPFKIKGPLCPALIVGNSRRFKYKWIFKIKQNEIFRARLVACRNIQIPGIDFNESFAPVINDVSFRIMLIAKLIWNFEASNIDVETAFLHGELQEEIHMNIPEGMSYDSKHCLLLTNTIYGLIQSTSKFYKVN
jgi:hypothetical protein